MIFLEQLTNQILREEGQVIVTFEDLNITWEQIEGLFTGVYEQCKQYIVKYDWVDDSISLEPQDRPQYSHLKHITYPTYFQRLMPDLPSNYWEFNPYNKQLSGLMNMNVKAEAGVYPTLTYPEYELPLVVEKDVKKPFMLPCSFEPESFKFADFEAFYDNKHPEKILLESNNGAGQFDTKTLTGYLYLDKDLKDTLKVTSKYVGIKELDMSSEIFVVWYKAALLQFIGSMKKQLDLTNVGLPFDINGDQLLERGRQYMDRVEELKGTKSHWSDF